MVAGRGREELYVRVKYTAPFIGSVRKASLRGLDILICGKAAFDNMENHAVAMIGHVPL